MWQAQTGAAEPERREHPRLTLNRLVRLHDGHGVVQSLVGINYSLSGIALQTMSPLPVGSQCELRFRLDDDSATLLKVVVEVRHNFSQGEIYTTGLRFLTMAGPDG